MSIPSSRAIHNFLDEQTRLFNDKSRKDDFMALYRQIAPGGYSLEWPANGDVFHGWDHLERMWQDGVKVQSSLVSAMVANVEAATYFTNKTVQDGKNSEDRKSVGKGKRVLVRLDPVGRRRQKSNKKKRI